MQTSDTDQASEQTMPDEAARIADILRRLQPAPFWNAMGCELTGAGEGRVTVRLPKRREHGRSSNTSGVHSAHGGAIATLIDMAASCALLTVLKPEEGRTTIDLNVHFLAPATGDLQATATVVRRGGRTAFLDIEVTCGDGTPAALGRTVFAILPPR